MQHLRHPGESLHYPLSISTVNTYVRFNEPHTVLYNTCIGLFHPHGIKNPHTQCMIIWFGFNHNVNVYFSTLSYRPSASDNVVSTKGTEWGRSHFIGWHDIEPRAWIAWSKPAHESWFVKYPPIGYYFVYCCLRKDLHTIRESKFSTFQLPHHPCKPEQPLVCLVMPALFVFLSKPGFHWALCLLLKCLSNMNDSLCWLDQ